jgi:uncharacterized membrane protein
MDGTGASREHASTKKGSTMRIPLHLSLAKTATFACLHFAIAFGLAYWLTGSVAIASALALLEPLVNTVAFFFHERAWARVQPGAAAVTAQAA